eukprot:119005_1
MYFPHPAVCPAGMFNYGDVLCGPTMFVPTGSMCSLICPPFYVGDGEVLCSHMGLWIGNECLFFLDWDAYGFLLPVVFIGFLLMLATCAFLKYRHKLGRRKTIMGSIPYPHEQAAVVSQPRSMEHSEGFVAFGEPESGQPGAADVPGEA